MLAGPLGFQGTLLLSGLQLGNKLGHMLAGPLGLQGTLLLGGVLHNGLDFVVALLSTLLEATACGGTELSGLLGASSDRGVLLHWLLGDTADLPGPLGALGVGGVSRGLVLTLLLNLSGALNHVVLHIVNLLLGPALGFVVGDVGGVAPPVVGVVALDNIVVLGLLHHLDLVNTPLAISTRSGSSNGRETHIGVVSLTLSTGLEGLDWLATMVLPMVTMVAFVMGSMVLALLGVEGECSEKVPALPSVAAELASTQCTAGEKAQCQCQLRGNHIDALMSLQVFTRALLN